LSALIAFAKNVLMNGKTCTIHALYAEFQSLMKMKSKTKD